MAAHATTRSSVYASLALGFHYPTPGLFEAFQSGEFLTMLLEDISALPHLRSLAEEGAELADKARAELEKVTFGDFEAGFIQTFDAGAPEPPCPQYEGFYRSGRTALMLEVSEFYRYFGLGMSKRELPDHLCAELEFLHFLAFKEAEAANDGELSKGYLLAQKDFLERHVAQWVPEFCERLQRSASVPFYAQLARIASLFVARDLEWVASELKS